VDAEETERSLPVLTACALFEVDALEMVLSLNRGMLSLPCLLLFVILSNSCSQSLTAFKGIRFRFVGVVMPKNCPGSSDDINGE